jgi:hypothetical protein
MTLSNLLGCAAIWREQTKANVKRVNQMRLYRLGNLTRLRSLIAGVRPDQGVNSITVVIIQLNAFVESEDNKTTCPAAVEKAEALVAQLNELYAADKPIDQNEINYLEFLLNTFETSLEDDLERLPTYVVEPVGAYSFGQLINAAETVFPASMRKAGNIPAHVILDFRSAGACLAFDLPTACGFHAFRATDAMLRTYCDHFGAKPKGNGRDWGRYIVALRIVLDDQAALKKPNKRTVELLDSIRDVDRNPVVHPDQNLDHDAALLMFDLCKNAVSLMVVDIKNSP